MTVLPEARVLYVDLSAGQAREGVVAQATDDVLGGRGLGARLLQLAVGGITTAFAPYSPIVLSAGPLCGTAFPGSARTDVLCTSPETGGLAGAGLTGAWGAELRQAGWDALVITGKADEPVYLWVRNDHVEIRSAADLWGAGTFAVEDAVRAKVDSPEARVLSIGPAGELLISSAVLHADLGPSRGQPGAGAVLGSKNCKAVAVRGTRGVDHADPDGLLEACLAAHTAVRSSESFRGLRAPHDEPRSGAPAAVVGAFPTSAWERKALACSACPVHCLDGYQKPGVGGVVVVNDGHRERVSVRGCDDQARRLELERFCQEQGADLHALEGLASWIAGLQRDGLLEVRLGGERMPDPVDAAIPRLVAAAGGGEGLGASLARGPAAVASYIDAQVKPSHRGGQSVLARLPGNETAWDAASGADAEAEARRLHETDLGDAVHQIVGSCEVCAGSLPHVLTAELYATALRACVGRSVSAGVLKKAALRARTLERALDALLCKGLAERAGVASEVTRRFRALRGWDAGTGLPREDTLRALGLAEVAAELSRRGLAPSAARLDAARVEYEDGRGPL